MLPPQFIGAWLGLWACVRLLCGLPQAQRLCSRGTLELEWWRVTVRLNDSGGGLVPSLGSKRKCWLRRWFSLGAAAGVLVGVCSVALLIHEAYTLLQQRFSSGTAGMVGSSSTAAEGATPRLQLALPGVTLPASHALPLWLALALSLVVHEAGHAFAAAAEGVQVTGAGLSVLLLVPAAFVELDSADLAALSRHSMLRVAAAGAWHNTVLGLACWGAAAALPAGSDAANTSNSSWAALVAAAGTVPLSILHLLLGYTASLSLALALLNMAPCHYLDGQQVVEAVLLHPRRPLKELPEEQQPCTGDSSGRDGGSSGWAGGGASGSRVGAVRAVRWVLHAGTTLYAAVVVLHLARVR